MKYTVDENEKGIDISVNARKVGVPALQKSIKKWNR